MIFSMRLYLYQTCIVSAEDNARMRHMPISSRARESRMAIIISARAWANSNAIIRLGLPSPLTTFEIHDFVFTSGHVRRIAEFAFSPCTCMASPRHHMCLCLRVSTRKHTRWPLCRQLRDRVYGVWDVCYTWVSRVPVCVCVHGPIRNGEYRRAILSESNEGYAPMPVLMLLIQLVDNLQCSNVTRAINRNRLACWGEEY